MKARGTAYLLWALGAPFSFALLLGCKDKDNDQLIRPMAVPSTQVPPTTPLAPLRSPDAGIIDAAPAADEMPEPLDPKQERVLAKQIKKWLSSSYSGLRAEANANDHGACSWKAATIQRYKGDVLAAVEGSAKQGDRHASLKMMFLQRPPDKWACVDELSIIEENGDAQQGACDAFVELCEANIIFSE